MNAQIVEYPIDLANVTRRFGSVVAVNDLTLRIPRGTTFGFIGLNGAGKTTAIRMMVGLLAPHTGRIQVAGVEVPRQMQQLKPRIGYVPDRPNVYSWMRVRDAIDFCRTLRNNWNQHRCDELLKLLDLDLEKRVCHLSKGMGAKLSLLLAISHDPEVLLLDEPTGGLDPLVREEFLEGVLAATTQREQAVLFSSHTLSVVQRLADCVGLLHEGRLLLHSPVDQLLERTKRIRAVLEDESPPVPQPPPGLVWQQVQGREWLITVENFSPDQIEFVRSRNRISHVDVIDLSLDDVFKDFVRGEKVTP